MAWVIYLYCWNYHYLQLALVFKKLQNIRWDLWILHKTTYSTVNMRKPQTFEISFSPPWTRMEKGSLILISTSLNTIVCQTPLLSVSATSDQYILHGHKLFASISSTDTVCLLLSREYNSLLSLICHPKYSCIKAPWYGKQISFITSSIYSIC